MFCGLLALPLYAVSFTPVSRDQAQKTPDLTKVETDVLDFHDIFEQFANLCARFDRYSYQLETPEENHKTVGHEAFQYTYHPHENIPEYNLDFRGLLPVKGELLLETASRATGNVHVDWIQTHLPLPRGEQFRRAQQGVLQALQSLAVDQRVLLYTGMAKTSKTHKHLVGLIDPVKKQVIFIQSGYCEDK